MKKMYQTVEVELNARMETCVLCGLETTVPYLQPVELRKYFVHGCGQLCSACYHSLVTDSDKGDRMTNEQLEELLKMSAVKPDESSRDL